MVVRVFADGDNHLGMIFVDPVYQRLGIGRRAWQFIEDTYPDARTWTLETAGYATTIHRFYEGKCGFSKAEVKPWWHPLGLWVYQKQMGRTSAREAPAGG
jgi:GNAT superfamily N-acetyltransferase